MAAPDTSVIVAAFAAWHEYHTVAREAIDAGATLIAHCALETYSVLTRLPAPHRVDADTAASFLRQRFPAEPIALSAGAQCALVRRLADTGVAGGAVYDALVATTAAEKGLVLLTLDRRAEPTYARVGAAFRRLA